MCLLTDPAICILLTTYLRTEYAAMTIRAIKQNLLWPQLWWMISDDGSPKEHVQTLVREIGPTYNIEVFDSARRGVGFGMNRCLGSIFEKSDLVLLCEDDWVLNAPLDMSPYVRLLTQHAEYGLVRFGYMCPDLLLHTVGEEGKLLYCVQPNGQTYIFSGHPSLRHRRFHEVYGYYDEGLPAGMTELSMCGKVNAKYGSPNPWIVFPAEYSCYGAFGHIGTESLKNMEPVR